MTIESQISNKEQNKTSELTAKEKTKYISMEYYGLLENAA